MTRYVVSRPAIVEADNEDEAVDKYDEGLEEIRERDAFLDVSGDYGAVVGKAGEV